MDNNRGQSIFLSVVGIATLLVAIIGATFAYFSIQVTGNESASSIHVTTAKLGGVTYTDDSGLIQVENAYPGYTKTKTFTVTSDADVDDTATIQYQIILKTTEPELASTAAPNHHFTYTLTPNAGNSTGSASAANGDMPSTTSPDVLLGTGTLTGKSAHHTYDFTVTLVESGSAQDELQGLTYDGIIQIVVANEQGLRTWDENSPGSWKQYTGN